MNPHNFFAELKRRNVYKVAITYAVVAWLLIQAASILLPTFEAPTWVMKAFVVLLAFGFVMSVMISWAFEATPEGLKRTKDVSPEMSLPSWSARKFAAFIISLALIAAGLFAFQFLRPVGTSRRDVGQIEEGRPGGASLPISQKSIAVLPLLNESGDPKDEYFSDGLSEELIAALAQIRELKVIGRSSSFRFKDRKEESKTIGEKLGVATLLEGTVRKQGERVRIVAELINAADGIELWTRTFDRELKDIFAVQQEIAAAVASSLKVTLLGADQRPSTDSATKNIEAHNAYLLGHYHFQRRNSKTIAKPSAYFDEAIRLDPEYALAYAERSEAWTLIGDLSGEGKTAWPKARERCGEGGRDRSGLAEAHAALGWVRFFMEWKFAEGLSELRHAKELSPANPTANDLLARVIVYLGKLDEAEKQARQAVELDPLAFRRRINLARILFVEGENWMKLTRSPAKPPSCSRPLLPVADSRCSSQSSAAMVRRHCTKRNWNPTKVIAVSNWRSRSMCAEIAGAADAALADLIAIRARSTGLSNRSGLCSARRERQSFRVVTNFIRYSRHRHARSFG